MDKLIDRINEIGDEISQHQHSIFLLEDEREQIEGELVELYTKQRQADDRDWQKMKL